MLPNGVEQGCPAYRDWLQRKLDLLPTPPLDEPSALPPFLGEHLARCADCRGLDGAARFLQQGLQQSVAPSLPAGLTGRLVAGVLADRRQRQRRRVRLAGTVALAASLLIVLLAGELLSHRPVTAPVAKAPPTPEEPLEPTPPLRETVAQAGSALGRLTARTFGEAVDGTRSLLPSVDESVLPPMEVPQPLEPTRSLQQAGQGVSAGLAPIADSARRAFALFRRDLPPLAPEMSGF